MSGDTNAFAVIVKNTEGLVAQIVFKMMNNVEERKDMAQEIYLKAYKSLPTFRFGSKLSTWIAQIAYNSCIDHIRKKKLVLVDSLYDENETGETMIDDRLSSSFDAEPEPLVFRKERSQILKAEIEKLPPVYRTLIGLFHQEEMSYDEIAQITQLPEGTLKSYLFRARKTLKDSLLRNYKKEEL